MPHVTLREIAAELGCTRSTVSYALKSRTKISTRMRQKVQATAQRLGWRPNAELQRHMALVRTSVAARDLPNLAIITNLNRQELTNEPCQRLQLEGAQRRAEQLGYQAEVINLATTPMSASRLRGILRARGVRGITYIATTGSNQIPAEILRVGCHFATSLAGVAIDDPPFHTAIDSVFEAGRMAIMEITKLGFDRVGAVLPEGLDAMLHRQFYGGIVSAGLELPRRSRVEVCYVGKKLNYIAESDYPIVQAWLAREKPDALLTTDVRYLSVCLKSGPKEFRLLPIFSLDWTPEQPAAGGIDGRAAEVGAAAIDLTVAQINRGEHGVPKVRKLTTVEIKWRMRAGFLKPRRSGSKASVNPRSVESR